MKHTWFFWLVHRSRCVSCVRDTYDKDNIEISEDDLEIIENKKKVAHDEFDEVLCNITVQLDEINDTTALQNPTTMQ